MGGTSHFKKKSIRETVKLVLFRTLIRQRVPLGHLYYDVKDYGKEGKLTDPSTGYQWIPSGQITKVYDSSSPGTALQVSTLHC
jgi:hypothetical protein